MYRLSSVVRFCSILALSACCWLSAYSQCFNMENLNAAGTVCKVANHEFEYIDATSYWYAWKWYDNTREDYGLTGYNSRYRLQNYQCTRQTVVKIQGVDNLQSQLQMLPPGKSTSIRLGNPYVGTPNQQPQIKPQQYASWHPQAEMIYFEFVVSADNPIILVDYAAIMDKANHAFSNTRKDNAPIITIRVKDTRDTVLNQNTTSFRKIGNNSLQNDPEWKSFKRSGYSDCYWKDWSTTGFDLTPYIGQKVRLCFENYECSFSTGTLTSQGYISGFNYCSEHFSYLYFYASCAPKTIEMECLDDGKARLSVPEGFTYQWFKQSAPGTIISTAREVVVVGDGTTYSCRLTQKDGMTGSFVLTASPLCSKEAYIYKTVCDGEGYFFDGALRTKTDTYTQVTPLGNGIDSTTYLVLTVQKPYTAPVEYATFCENTPYTWVGHGTKFAALSEEKVYRDTLRYKSGCDSLYCELHLTKQERVKITETHTVCPEFFDGGNGFDWHGISIDQLADDGKQVSVPSATGCDTLFTLRLKTSETVVSYDTVISETYGFQWTAPDGRSFNINSVLANLYHTNGYSFTNGACKEKVYLTVIIAKKVTESITKCATELPFTWHGATIHGMQNNGLRIEGKDANNNLTYYYLDLTVNNVSTVTIDTTLCYGNSFSIGVEEFSTAGNYKRTLTNAAGCDSTITLHLHITDKPEEIVENWDICFGETLPWFDHEAKYPSLPAATATYHDTIFNSLGCDSIRFTLNTTLRYPSASTIKEEICKGDSLHFFDTVLYTTGFYNRTIFNTYGCDSVITMDLTVSDTKTQTFADTICDGETLAFADTLLKTTGTYSRRLTTYKGCDSLLTINLLVGKKYNIKIDTAFCDGGQYAFSDTVVKTTGIYTRHYLTYLGCDSIVTADVTVHPLYHQEKTLSLCKGGEFAFSDTIVKTTGHYTRRYTDRFGCDSVIVLHLTVNDIATGDTAAYICQPQLPYRWHGKMLYDKGEEKDTLVSYLGCDSIVTLHLEVGMPTSEEVYDTICRGQKYPFNGGFYSRTDSYPVVLTNAAMCDSTVTLHLFVADPTSSMKYDTICQGDTYAWEDTILSTSGVYSRHCLNYLGCDSTASINLHLLQPSVKSLNLKVCEGEEYAFSDTIVKTVGVYTRHYLNAAGCDSTVTLDFVISDATELAMADTYCEGGSYIFADSTIITPGTYTHTFVREGKCDSTVILTLTEEKAPVSYESKTIIEGQTYPFGGKLLKEKGIYRDTTYEDITHCMLITELTLSVNPPDENTIYEFDTICLGDVYNWQGHPDFDSLTVADSYIDTSVPYDTYILNLTVQEPRAEATEEAIVSFAEPYNWIGHPAFTSLTESGTYFDTAYYTSGCDSVYYTLHLRIYNPVVEVDILADTVCADDDSFALHISTLDGKPQTADIIFGDKAHAAGFKDTTGLTVSDKQETFFISVPAAADKMSYIRPDDYSLTIRITDVFGHITSHPAALTVIYPSWVVMQRWKDVLMVQNEKYNGGYIFSSIAWEADRKAVAAHGEHNGYLYVEGGLKQTTAYRALLTRADDGKTLPTCDVYYADTVVSETLLKRETILLSPENNNSRKIRVEANCAGSYIIYAADGRQLGNGEFGNLSPAIDFPISVPQGIYLIRFTTDSGNTITKKWQVR